MFSYSQDEWEGNLNLTYPPIRLNGIRTAAPRIKPFGRQIWHMSGVQTAGSTFCIMRQSDHSYRLCLKCQIIVYGLGSEYNFCCFW
jgi:hypothetical protein